MLLQKALAATDGKEVYLWTLRDYHDCVIRLYEQYGFKLDSESRTKSFNLCKFVRPAEDPNGSAQFS